MVYVGRVATLADIALLLVLRGAVQGRGNKAEHVHYTVHRKVVQ